MSEDDQLEKYEPISPSRAGELKPIQVKAITLLLEGLKKQDILDELDITRPTLWRWETDNEAFIEELNDRKNEMLENTVRRMASVNNPASDVMYDALEDVKNHPKTDTIVDRSEKKINMASKALKATGAHGESIKALLNDEKDMEKSKREQLVQQVIDAFDEEELAGAMSLIINTSRDKLKELGQQMSDL